METSLKTQTCVCVHETIEFYELVNPSSLYKPAQTEKSPALCLQCKTQAAGDRCKVSVTSNTFLKLRLFPLNEAHNAELLLFILRAAQWSRTSGRQSDS